MATRRKSQPVEETHTEEEPSAALEPIDAELDQQLTVVASTLKTFSYRTRDEYPVWSAMMGQLLMILKDTRDGMLS